MTVYLVVGRLGSGKSLAAVGRAIDYASSGRRVAANFHLDFAPVARRAKSPLARAVVDVLPARPSSADLVALGIGGPREDRAGLVILDECSTFLNARAWNERDRAAFIEWFMHSRKLGWDVLFIVQHQSMLDKQVRENCEMLVTVRRLDKMKIPILSWILPFKMPRLHIAQVRYGLGPTDPTAEHWVYRGTGYFRCYDTKWISGVDCPGAYSVLPARITKFGGQRASRWWSRLLLWLLRSLWPARVAGCVLLYAFVSWYVYGGRRVARECARG